MKKYLLLPIIIIISIFTANTATSAGLNPTYTISAGTIFNAGETLEVKIGISDNPGIISLRFNVVYDTDILELVGVQNTGLISGFSVPSTELSSPYTLRWSDPLAAFNNTNNGEAAVLTFKVLEAMNTSVEIVHLESRNLDGVKVDFSDVAANVTLPLTVSVVERGGNDLIEIRNNSDKAVSTRGLYISDDDSDLFKRQLPVFVIRPSEFILINCGIDSGVTELKRAITDFDLSAAERVCLSNAVGDVLSDWECLRGL